MRRCLTAVICAVMIAALFARPGTAAAQQPIRQVQGGVLLNFQDADLAFVLSALAQAAGINFAYSDLPEKPVTLRTNEPLTRDQVLSLIHSIAGANGVSVFESDGVLRLQGSVLGIPEDPRQLYIHRLRHARAPVLAQTLQALFGGGSITGVRAGGAGGNTLTQQLRQMEIRSQAGQPQQIFVSGGGPAQGASAYGVLVVPDEVTNSLLIRATASDWQVMQQAIQSLDLRPLQVVIEVVIAEVRRTDDLNVGVSVSADASQGDRTTIGDLPPGTSSTGRDNDFTMRIIRNGDIDIEATLSALAATGNVRILSRPVIQAQNNQEARILVGSERPFIQVSRGVGNIPGQVSEEIVQYRDVATTLTITPTINEDGYINMAITQEINNATNETQFGAPIISTREAVTQLLARDGQTIVIGGLIDQQDDRSRSGIPFLKDIPILGALFGTTRNNIASSELFLFLTPHIVATDADADRMKREVEQNADLLEPLTPIVPLIPPTTRPVVPDTIPVRIPPVIIPPDTMAIRPDTMTVRPPARGGW